MKVTLFHGLARAVTKAVAAGQFAGTALPGTKEPALLATFAVESSVQKSTQ